MIKFTCPNCNVSDQTDDRQAGSAIKCRFCKGQIMLPALPVAKIQAVAPASRTPPDDSYCDLFGRPMSDGLYYARNLVAIVVLALAIFATYKFVQYVKRQPAERAVEEAVEEWARDVADEW